MKTKIVGLGAVVAATVIAAAVAFAAAADESAILKVLRDYQAAMAARSVGQLATVVSDVAAGGPVVLLGAETFVFGKTEKGWKIKHVHLSGKRIGPARPQ